MMTVRLAYELTGTGWADCAVEIDGQEVTISASYLSDALDDLSAAVISVLRGDASATAKFAEEPGTFRWEFRREGTDQLSVCIYWDQRRWNDAPHDPGTPLFDGRCQLRAFAGQVLAALQRLLAQHGEGGYRNQWVLYDFPTKRLAALESLLRDS